MGILLIIHPALAVLSRRYCEAEKALVHYSRMTFSSYSGRPFFPTLNLYRNEH